MAILERLRRGSREPFTFSSRALRGAEVLPGNSPEVPQVPIYSEAFTKQLEAQRSLDAHMAALVPTNPLVHVGFGQDRDVSMMTTDRGEFVVKTLKPTSRAHMMFGLGIPAAEIPPDTEMGNRRTQLADFHSGVDVDPYVVAEKVRLVHVMATTHLDRGDKIIWPTATVVIDGQVENRQKYIPRFDANPCIQRDPREVELESKEKVKLFRTLQERWRDMILTPDFRNLPPDVQDYWKSYPPDSGHGTNAHFFGIGHVVAYDY